MGDRGVAIRFPTGGIIVVPGLNRLRPRSVSGPAIVMTVAVVVALCTFIHRKPALLGVEPGSSQQMYWMAGVIAAGVVFLIIMGVYHLLNRHAAVQNFELRRQLAAGDYYRAVTTKKADSRHPAMVELAAFLRDRYGPFWRRNVRLLLVTGEPEQAEAIAPGLTGQHWLEGDHTVLIYGGRPSAEPDVTLLTALKKLRRSRPLDGIIWPLTEEQSRQTAQLDKGWRELINGGKRLGFQAPLYLWQVCDNGDYQAGRPLQSVGCLLPERCPPEQLTAMLEAHTLPLTEQGMSQLLADIRLRFECGPLVGDWSQIDLSRLPFYLNADSPVACALHRALTLGTQQFWLRLPGQDRRTLDAHFSPLGFEDNDRLWPKGESAFSGYQLLLEYFTFREKFMFVALNGLELVAWPEGIPGVV